MPDILPPEDMRAGAAAEIVIVGAGACGLVAALAAAERGREVLVLERDRTPTGSTALSSGFIPAPGTRFQRALGIEDSPALLAEDIASKTLGRADPAEALLVAEAAGPALEWLADRHGIPFEVLQGFLYPGHTRLRMHAVPERTGAGLMARLLAAAADIPLSTQAHVRQVFADADGRVHGVRVLRPDGAQEDVACGALILACNGYGGAPDLLRRLIPAIAEAPYLGHAGNKGDALLWGWGLGAATRDLSGYQGHGNVAQPHGILITWALLMEGGIQVDRNGHRFGDETRGYSEQAVAVLSQPGGTAWTVYDARLHALGLTFPDYQQAEAAGAIRMARDLDGLAAVLGTGPGLQHSVTEAQSLATSAGTDAFGRVFKGPPLTPPFYAVRVTGALFHTQGGLVVDASARVLRQDGSALPNLFAGGGAARGVSGPEVSGYLSGNGLLTALAYGRLAGLAAGG